MKFSEMPYKRPDQKAAESQIRRLTASLENAGDFAEADGAFLQMDQLSREISTADALVTIRHQINTADSFYDAEQTFIDGFIPAVQEYVQLWQQALVKSRFRPEFEKKYGPILFVNTELAMKAFSPGIVDDMQKENELVTEYDKLIASAQIPFEGGVYTLSQISPFKQDTDEARRHAAWRACGDFYMEHASELDGIYDKLVGLRDKMAKKLGYKDYITLGYYRMTRNCYDKNDVERFRESVRKYLVPVADEIYRAQARRMGYAYPISYADMGLEFASGNPKPRGTADDILAAGKKFYSELSAETGEFFNFMLDGELMDVLSRKGKSGGGYCCDIPMYRVPFIFANFNGTQADVNVMTHEAGHAFAYYAARNTVPAELSSPSMESAEIHSMSMEFFAWPWLEEFFGRDAEKYRYSHLASAITFIPYGTLVDHFQHEMYVHPEYSPLERHQVWRKLTAVYMPWVNQDDGLPFYGQGRRWQQQSHIYEVPFYYIDYCLAQSVALQFWVMMRRDRGAAWDAYRRLVGCAGKKTFTGLVETAGLASPFQEDSLRAVCAEARTWLENFDQRKLK